jgi:hypothetical protein
LRLVVVLAASGGWAAARATLASSPSPTSPTETGLWATAKQASIGRSLPLSTTLRQPEVPVAANALVGVVTSTSAGKVKQGDVIYVVGDTPVRVVAGDRPFWRDLARGVKGSDVAALQRALVDLGFFHAAPTGTFGADTEAAVRRWQKTLRQPQSGAVVFGELVAVKRLPIVVGLGDAIRVGKPVSGGEESVLAPTGERVFVMVVTPDQARLIPAEATVDVKYQDHTWPATIAEVRLDENGSTQYVLTGPDGKEVCTNQCATLPTDAQVTLSSSVVIVPKVTGIGVPAGAVRTSPEGATYVVTETGRVDVSVRGSSQGVAVIDGLDEGVRVQVFAGPDKPTPATRSEPPSTPAP